MARYLPAAPAKLASREFDSQPGRPGTLDLSRFVRPPRPWAHRSRCAGCWTSWRSVVEACRALQAYPATELTWKRWTTGRAWAAVRHSARRIPEFGGPGRPAGPRIDVVRGQGVRRYQELLGTVA